MKTNKHEWETIARLQPEAAKQLDAAKSGSVEVLAEEEPKVISKPAIRASSPRKSSVREERKS